MVTMTVSETCVLQRKKTSHIYRDKLHGENVFGAAISYIFFCNIVLLPRYLRSKYDFQNYLTQKDLMI